MKRSNVAVLALFASATIVVGQEDDKIFEWMKSVDTSAKVLRKLEKKTGPEAADNAAKIGTAYDHMIGYWRERNAPDAVKLSEEGKAAAAELVTAAQANDEAKSAAAFTKLGGTCRPCHEAHREKLPDGKYKVK